uniref:Uncharacterized protein n=1 Tax=Candidatus Kentrum sp. MB TaxID=2138164 RepID=A0A450Y1P8_9GAMM|nr:MAG: hypothetical protein BECKMB1821I_GA0114274_111913 [Candidatus Kentron sp. MB]VFK77640.1 MAG: hypothetical protein BECKMB1821H_GA0114242_11963 [Candidatus Kentron sp. MB]
MDSPLGNVNRSIDNVNAPIVKGNARIVHVNAPSACVHLPITRDDQRPAWEHSHLPHVHAFLVIAYPQPMGAHSRLGAGHLSERRGNVAKGRGCEPTPCYNTTG